MGREDRDQGYGARPASAEHRVAVLPEGVEGVGGVHVRLHRRLRRCTVSFGPLPFHDLGVLTPCRRGGYGEELFTIGGTYFEGRPPRSVNFYWRRFRIDDIPLDDAEEFDAWLRERWYEKDALIEGYVETGKFPPLPSSVKGDGKAEEADGFVETDVRTKSVGEFTRIYVVLGTVYLLWRIASRFWEKFTG